MNANAIGLLHFMLMMQTHTCCATQAVSNLVPIASPFLSMCHLMFSYSLQRSLLDKNFHINSCPIWKSFTRKLSEFTMTLLLYIVCSWLIPHPTVILEYFWIKVMCMWIYGIQTYRHTHTHLCVCVCVSYKSMWCSNGISSDCKQLIVIVVIIIIVIIVVIFIIIII